MKLHVFAALALLQAAAPDGCGGPALDPDPTAGTTDTARTSAPDAGGHCDGPDARPTFGAYAAGDEVIKRGGGPTWWPMTVERPGNPDDWAEVDKYRLTSPTGGDYADYYDVARAGQREAWWTCLFVGDWEVSVPVAATVVTDGRDLYRQWSGGMRLPPLRIHADGTYLWRVEEGGAERVIEGRWVAEPDHPGLVLLDGQDGADWTVYNTTDRSTRETFGRDAIILSPSEGAGYLRALRIE